MSSTTSTKRWRSYLPVIGYVLIVAAMAVMGAFLWQTIQQRDVDRTNATILNCHRNQAQDEVLRVLIRTSIDQQGPATQDEEIRLEQTYQRILKKSPVDEKGKPLSVREMRIQLSENLLAPVGGLRATKPELQAQCDRQLREAGLKP